MGKIKSALEIALERTESVKSDKDVIGLFEAKQKGKKLANEYLEGVIKSFEAELKKEPNATIQKNLKQGIFDVLLSQISLPGAKEDLQRIGTAARGLSAVIGNKHFDEIVRQFSEIMNQYLNEAAQYEEAIKRQYAPKLRQKEEEISRRFGRQITIEPFQDPEFLAFYNQHLGALKENYQAAVEQVRDEASRIFNDE